MAKVEFSSTSFSQPDWAAQPLDSTALVPGGAFLVVSAFNPEDYQVLTLAAGVITAGTGKTLTLTAPLQWPIPAGYILDFGSSEFATLTLGAAKGATSITGVTLAADLEGGESATFAGVSPIINVPSGTLVGRTYAERDAGTGYGQPDVVTPDDQLYLTAFEAIDLRNNNEVALVRHTTLIYEDRLPGWSSLSTGVKTAIRQRYQCIKSAN